MVNAKRADLLTEEVYLEFLKEFKSTGFPGFFKQMKTLYIPAGRSYVKTRKMKEPMVPPSTSVTNVPASFQTTSSTPLPTSSLKKRKSSGSLAEESPEPPSPLTPEPSPAGSVTSYFSDAPGWRILYDDNGDVVEEPAPGTHQRTEPFGRVSVNL